MKEGGTCNLCVNHRNQGKHVVEIETKAYELPFSYSILLVCVGIGDPMHDAYAFEQRIEFLIFHSPVGLNTKNLPI